MGRYQDRGFRQWVEMAMRTVPNKITAQPKIVRWRIAFSSTHVIVPVMRRDLGLGGGEDLTELIGRCLLLGAIKGLLSQGRGQGSLPSAKPVPRSSQWIITV